MRKREGSVPVTNGSRSGSWRHKNMRILRIRSGSGSTTLGISKLQFLIKKDNFFPTAFFPIFGHQNPGSGSVFSLKCWIRIRNRNKWIRLRITGQKHTLADSRFPECPELLRPPFSLLARCRSSFRCFFSWLLKTGKTNMDIRWTMITSPMEAMMNGQSRTATAYHNDAWTCPRPSYIEKWTLRAK
jgi:hypothetical protein